MQWPWVRPSPHIQLIAETNLSILYVVRCGMAIKPLSYIKEGCPSKMKFDDLRIAYLKTFSDKGTYKKRMSRYFETPSFVGMDANGPSFSILFCVFYCIESQ